MHDVVIVGASIAGAAVAIAAARDGQRVVLLDQHEAPRRKACGEGILPAGVAALRELGLLEALAARGARLNRLRFEAGEAHAEARLPAPGLGLRRSVIDAVLRGTAVARGVELRTGVTVTGLEVGRGRVTAVSTDHGPVAGRAFVAADGLHSRLRRLAGLDGGRTGSRFGISVHIRAPSIDADVVRVLFRGERELYVTPLGGEEANLAMLMRKPAVRRFAPDLAGAVRQELASDDMLASAEVLDRPVVAGPFPRGCRRMWRANLVLAGDAAGFFDGISGEGMSLALASAPVCASALGRYLESGSYEGFRAYEAARRSRERFADLLARLSVLLGSRERMAEVAIRNLGRRTRTFEKLVAISGGQVALTSLRPSDIVALATGR